LKPTSIPLDELEDNEDELIRIMHYNFLMGLDKKFIDYTNIDDNELNIIFIFFKNYI